MTATYDYEDGLRDRCVDDPLWAADEIQELRNFVLSLGIEVMHPDMGGSHQCKIWASGRKLTGKGWAIVDRCRDGAS